MEKVKTTSTRKDLNYACWLTKQSVISANYNEQYSRKNHVNVFNFTKKQNENLRIEVNITLCHRTSANTVKQYKASFKNALGPTFQPLGLYQDHTHWIFCIQMYMETRMWFIFRPDGWNVD